jgi:hypothetical protein
MSRIYVYLSIYLYITNKYVKGGWPLEKMGKRLCHLLDNKKYPNGSKHMKSPQMS